MAWSVHCHILLGDLDAAARVNDRAIALAKGVFGDVAWELQRCMVDKVWIVQHSWDTTLGPASNEGRKAYSLAERWDTHAQILLTTLTSDKVEDVAVSELSIFAPLKRDLVLRPEDDPEAQAAKSRAGKKARKNGKKAAGDAPAKGGVKTKAAARGKGRPKG